jgi:DNA-binding beta-propeller fold protein YncE
VTELAVSANDSKIALVDGVVRVVADPPPDTLTVLDLAASPPRVVAEIPAPASAIGPPLSVALTPDQGLALVTAAQKVDPADPTRQTADNRLSVVDLRATPPRVIATLEAGRSPAGLSINRQGTLALVANREEGTVSVFTIAGRTVTPAGKVALGAATSGPSHVAFTPDGRTALVTRDGDDRISVLAVEGTTVEYTRRDMYAGLRPYGIDVARDGAYAAVANVGRGAGDHDTISLIDLRARPPRVVETVTVGPSPEGIKVSPDGSVVAVVLINGTSLARSSPFHHDRGKLVLLRVTGTALAKVAEAPIGGWSQGVAFSADGRTILAGNMVERDVQVFAWDGRALRETARIPVSGGSAALRTAEP